jgi:hypothetical protein
LTMNADAAQTASAIAHPHHAREVVGSGEDGLGGWRPMSYRGIRAAMRVLVEECSGRAYCRQRRNREGRGQDLRR